MEFQIRSKSVNAINGISRKAVRRVIGITVCLLIAGCDHKEPTGPTSQPADVGATRTRKVTIGAVLPLTGDAAVYGQAIKMGMQLAFDELDPNSQRSTQIVYEDDQGKASAAVSAVNKLISVDHATVIIGGAMSSTAEAIIPITEKHKIILISPCATKSSLTDNTKWFFRLWPSDSYDGRVMAEVAYNKLGLRRIGILYINSAYGQGLTEVFVREFKRLGGDIVLSEGYDAGSKDFRTQIQKLRAAGVDAIYLPGYISEISVILRQLREISFAPRILGSSGLYDPALVRIAGEAAEGMVLTFPGYDPKSPSRDVKSFIESFKNKFAKEPDGFAAAGYDAVRVLVMALQSAPSGDPQSLRSTLTTMGEYSGPGGSIRFLDNGNVDKILRVITVKGGQFVDFE